MRAAIEELDKMIILNARRPHQRLEQGNPVGKLEAYQQGSVRYREAA